jgi:DNA-binding NarL/FixJ family response regulator
MAKEATLSDLLTQMKMTNRLLAAQLFSRMQQNEIVHLLSSTGASNSEIADVLGTTPNTVKVTLHRLKTRVK